MESLKFIIAHFDVVSCFVGWMLGMLTFAVAMVVAS